MASDLGLGVGNVVHNLLLHRRPGRDGDVSAFTCSKRW